MSFWAELKRRNVVKVAIAYAIVSWLLVQVAGLMFPVLLLPDWLLRAFVVFLMLLLPIALLLAWVYEITPEGIKRTVDVPPAQSTTHVTGQKLNYVVTALLVAAVALMAVDNYVLDDRGESTPGAAGSATAADSTAPAAAAGAADATAGGATAATDGRLPNSVAVLPFKSLSADANDVYITAGIHEEILNQLVRLGGLNPISRTTMMRYADSSKAIPEIARELNVESVIEGSVRRAGERVLVTVQLIDPATDLYLWSESYERDLADLFGVQIDIARNVVQALEVQLSVPDQEALSRDPPTRSREAYELYLAALGLARAPTNETVLAAIERLDRALELDPEFIDAWAYKASGHAVLSGLVADPQAQYTAAVAAASRAIELDPRSSRGHAALGFALYPQGEWARAREEFERARALGAPVSELTPYSVMQMAVGDFAGARETLLADLALNPMNGTVAGFLLAAHEMTGERAARRAGYDRGEALFGTWFGDSIEILIRLGEEDAEYLRAWSGGQGGPGEAVGAREEGLEAMRTLYDEAVNPNAIQLLLIAAWTAYFGDADLSSRLAREVVARQRGSMWYFWLPLFEDVRRVPDFKSLVRDLGLVDYWREYGWPPFCRPLDGEDFECA
jgi:TolB-like protein